jgi:hypothetical protein
MSPKQTTKPKSAKRQPQSAKRTAINDERQQMRAQLQAAGWVVGQKIQQAKGQRVTIELWPVPHTPETGAAAGIEPRRVSGTNLRDAMRRALQSAAAPDPAVTEAPAGGHPRAVLTALKHRLTPGE